ncbi:MAG: hypothetical protein USCAAHI_00477 [Beijerinckiaceae bacterium]|nr:MAG: hypothetical protein USCAAHI_00477 [Beijerinckiaceae bacterium]
MLLQRFRGRHPRLQPHIRRIDNSVNIGFDGLHRDSPGVCVHDCQGGVEAFFAPRCDGHVHFVHFGRQIALEGKQPALLLRPVGDACCKMPSNCGKCSLALLYGSR